MSAKRQGVETALVLGWMGTLAACALSLVLQDPNDGLALVGVSGMAFGVCSGLQRGGPWLTPSGIFVFSSAAFVGLASFYLASLEANTNPSVLRDVAALVLATTVVTHATVILLTAGVNWTSPQPSESMGFRHPPRTFVIAAVLLMAFSQFPLARTWSGPLAKEAGFAGIVMLLLIVSARHLHLRTTRTVVQAILVAMICLAWISWEFSGFGRLQVAGLGAAALMGWNLRQARTRHKWTLVAATPAFLVFSAISRLRLLGLDADQSTLDRLRSGRGLGSLYIPLDTFGQIVSWSEPSALGPRLGATFINSMLLPIPRDFWPGKPKGFGAELTEVMLPGLVDAGHSMAALIHGEWYVNFGWAGVLAMPLIVGWILAHLDRLHATAVAADLDTPKAWWSTTVVLCLASGLPTLYWGGTFTYFQRSILPAAIVIVVARLAQARPVRPTRSSSATDPSHGQSGRSTTLRLNA